jgi:formylglycine-generating enzyme required for sulfatase activity
LTEVPAGSPYAKDTPAGETQNRRPIEIVNWYAAIAFCNKLSLANGRQPVYSVNGVSDWGGLAYSSIPIGSDTNWDNTAMDTTKNGYRFPTDTEWMWAAMGADRTSQPNTTGYSKAFAGSTGSNRIDAYACDNSDSKTHEVGRKTANELELSDMSGNLFEWCWDRYDSYLSGEQTDYTGSAAGTLRLTRGGHCFDYASTCIVALRSYYGPYDRVHPAHPGDCYRWPCQRGSCYPAFSPRGYRESSGFGPLQPDKLSQGPYRLS